MPERITPRQAVILRALNERDPDKWHTANSIAAATRLDRDIRRHGNGAKGPQSWSGYVAPALGIGRTLAGLAQRGLVYCMRDPENRYRGEYRITPLGRGALVENDGVER